MAINFGAAARILASEGSSGRGGGGRFGRVLEHIAKSQYDDRRWLKKKQLGEQFYHQRREAEYERRRQDRRDAADVSFSQAQRLSDLKRSEYEFRADLQAKTRARIMRMAHQYQLRTAETKHKQRMRHDADRLQQRLKFEGMRREQARDHLAKDLELRAKWAGETTKRRTEARLDTIIAYQQKYPHLIRAPRVSVSVPQANFPAVSAPSQTQSASQAQGQPRRRYMRVAGLASLARRAAQFAQGVIGQQPQKSSSSSSAQRTGTVRNSYIRVSTRKNP